MSDSEHEVMRFSTIDASGHGCDIVLRTCDYHGRTYILDVDDMRGRGSALLTEDDRLALAQAVAPDGVVLIDTKALTKNLPHPAHILHTYGQTFIICAEEDADHRWHGCFAEIVDGQRSKSMWHRCRRAHAIHEDACKEAFYLVILDVMSGWHPADERARLAELREVEER